LFDVVVAVTYFSCFVVEVIAVVIVEVIFVVVVVVVFVKVNVVVVDVIFAFALVQLQELFGV